MDPEEEGARACDICFEPYCSDPSARRKEREPIGETGGNKVGTHGLHAPKRARNLPIQSSKCPHVVCLGCIEDIRDAHQNGGKPASSNCNSSTLINPVPAHVRCPTCQAESAFDVDQPTVSLIMCEFVRFAAETDAKKRKANEQQGKLEAFLQRKEREDKSKRSRKERGAKLKKRREEYAQPERSTRILLAKAAGEKAKFLTDVKLVADPSQLRQVELPRELVLDGWTREEWSRESCNTNEDRIWKRVLLRSVDTRRYVPGFLEHLKERRKAAYGTFVLPSGLDGFLVVPYEQPRIPRRGEDAEKHGVLICKVVIGMNLIESKEDKITAVKTKQTNKEGFERVDDLESEHAPPVLPVDTSSDQNNLARLSLLTPQPDSNAIGADTVAYEGRSKSLATLSTMIASKVETDEKVASVPQIPRPPNSQLPVSAHNRGRTNDWYGWHKFGRPS